MKGKHLLGGVLAAIAGGLISLAIYASVVGKPLTVASNDSAIVERERARASALFTSMQAIEGQIDFTFAAEETVHAVVHVQTKSTVRESIYNPIYEWFYGNQDSRQRRVEGIGSGVIISPDGYIITNNHVIDGTDEIEVKLNDNRTFEAKIVGQDPSSDIAVLKIDAKDLSYLKYGDSDNLKVGQWVLAVGNPFNLTSTVTAGIVSAKGRNLSLLTEDYKIESFIQTDAALNPGNSGGALVDTKGLLVGITSAIYSPSGAYSGNSFAIPVSIVKKVVEDLIEYGEVQRALLGVSIREVTPEDASKNKLSQVRGAFVAEIIESGAAKSSDLEVGDIIIKVNGVDIYTITELQEQVGRYRPGDKVSVTYFRDGRERSTQVTLKNIMGTTDVVKPGMGTTAIMGARMETLSRNELRNYRISNGVKIVEINDGRLKDLGLREGSIVISVNGKNVNSAEDVRQVTDNGTTLRNIEGIQPNGAYFSYRLTN